MWLATAAAPRGHCGGWGAPGAPVGAQDDVGIEQGDKGIEIASTRSREEGVNHISLTSELGVRGRHVGALHATTCPAGELPRRPQGFSPTGGATSKVISQGHLDAVLNANRSAGARVSSTTRRAKSDRVGQQRLLLRLEFPVWADYGSGRCTPKDSSRRTLRERSMFRHTWATIVVNHLPKCSRPGSAPVRLEAQPCVLDGVVGLR